MTSLRPARMYSCPTKAQLHSLDEDWGLEEEIVQKVLEGWSFPRGGGTVPVLCVFGGAHLDSDFLERWDTPSRKLQIPASSLMLFFLGLRISSVSLDIWTWSLNGCKS